MALGSNSLGQTYLGQPAVITQLNNSKFGWGSHEWAQIEWAQNKNIFFKISSVISARLITSKNNALRIKHSFIDQTNSTPASYLFKTIIRRRNSGPIQTVAATVTRNVKAGRKGSVIISYQIGVSKNKTQYRKAVASVVGLIKYNISRIVNINLKEETISSVQPVNQINSYVISNDINQSGEDVVPT